MANPHLLHWLLVQRCTLKQWHAFSNGTALLHNKRGYHAPLEEQLGNKDQRKHTAARRSAAKRRLRGHQLKRRVLQVRHGLPRW